MGLLNAIGNALDGIVYAMNPKAGLQRMAVRRAKNMLEKVADKIEAGRPSRQTLSRRRSFKQTDPNEARDGRYITNDLEINSLIDETLTDVQTRAVGLYGENGIARSVIETRVTYEIGSGLTLKPMVKSVEGTWLTKERAKRINDELKELIVNWSENGVDKHRQLSFAAVQRLMCREYRNEGECFVLVGDVPYDGTGSFAGPLSTAIEIISPRRVATPPDLISDENVRLGIRYGRHGEVAGYYVRDTHPTDTNVNADHSETYKYYTRFDSAGNIRMEHIFDPLFAGQSRGLVFLLSAMNKILDYDDYHEAEIVTKQVEACFGVVFKIGKSDDAESLYDMAEAAAEETVNDELIEKFTPGWTQRIKAEDSIDVVDPSRPGNNFAPFLEGSMRQIAAATQTPYELIAKNFFRTTFSSGRLAVLDGQMSFTMHRNILIDMGLRPLYKRVVNTIVFANELYGALPIEVYMENPYLYSRHKYYCKQMGLIDSEKEIKAFTLGKQSGLLTDQDFHEERGDDWEAQDEQKYEESIRQIDTEIALEKYRMEQRKANGLPEQSPDEEKDPKSKRDEKMSHLNSVLWTTTQQESVSV